MAEVHTRRVEVLTLVDFLVAGGAERMAVDIATGLDPQRFASTVCSTRFTSDPERRVELEPTLERLRAAGVGFLPLSRTATTALWQWRPLLGHLARRRPDVVHAHKFGSNVWGTVFGRATRVPVVVAHEHTWSYEGRPVRKLLDRQLIARGADMFVAVSEQDRRKMIEVERVPAQVTTVIRGGLPPGVAPSGRDARAEFGLAPDDRVVVAVGMLRAQKAFDVLIEAAALLRSRIPALAVLIAGGRNEMEAVDVPGHLERLIAAHDLGGTVHLLGRRDDVPDLLAAADLAVLSSDYEGTPLALMEYMRAGTPFVATRVGGVPEIVEDGVHGRLVEPRSPTALAEAIAASLADPETARTMATRARARVETELTLEATVRKVEQLYERLLAEKAPRRRWHAA